MANFMNDFTPTLGHISEEGLEAWEKLGYSTKHYVPVSEIREEGEWVIQFFYPKAETLYEADLLDNKVRHRGLEVGCFWTEWEEMLI